MRRPRAKSIQHRLEISFLQKNMILSGLAFLREHGERCHFRLCLAATDLVCLSIVLIVLFGFLFVRAIPPRTATPPENPSRNKRRKKAGIDLWTSRPFQLRSQLNQKTRCWSNVGLLLGHRLRQCHNNKPPLGACWDRRVVSPLLSAGVT